MCCSGVAVDTQFAGSNNLLPENCPLDESICSGTMESIRFHHTESSGEIEVDISRGDRGAISLGEEIHEEGR